jgi:type IV secretory pathway VirB10-like protein
MSMLNDALKRASQTDRERQRPIPVPARVSIEPVADPRGKSLAMAMVAGSVLALGLAAWFFGQVLFARHPDAIVGAEAAPVVPPESVPPPVVSEAPTVPAVVMASPPPMAAPDPTPAPAPEPPARPVEPAWPANLKLTGIFFRKNNPLALISGKTVAVGEEINGVRVKKIEKDRVTLEWNGRMRELLVDGGEN